MVAVTDAVLIGEGVILILLAAWMCLGRRYDHDPAPDWEALHLERFARFVLPECHPGCVAHNDQAIAELAGWLTSLGVDLDDPHQLHATLAALSIGAQQALYRPFHAGRSLACHVNVLAGRVPGGEGR